MTPNALLLTVALAFDVSVATLQSSKRTRYVSHARQCAAWVLRQRFPDLSLQAIGDLLGKDHTTIIYALKAVEQRMRTDTALAETLRALVPVKQTRAPKQASDRAFWGVRLARTA
jgi:chromosomal replication initiator protein